MAYKTSDVLSVPEFLRSRDDVKELQRQLNQMGANLAVDGVYGKKTEAAYQSLFNSSGSMGNRGTVSYEAPAYRSEAERLKSINDHLAGWNISYNSPPFAHNMGAYGHDGLGGVYNPLGYSSSKNYLPVVAGVTREQLKGTLLSSMSDRAMESMIGANQPFVNDLFIDPVTGRISSVNPGNWLNMGEARKVYGALTGQVTNLSDGIQQQPVPFVQGAYYSSGQRQQGFDKLQQQLLQAQQNGYPLPPQYTWGFQGGGSKTNSDTKKKEPTLIDDLLKEVEARRKREIDLYQKDVFGRVL